MNKINDATNPSSTKSTHVSVAVRVIHTDEEYMIAKTVCRVLGLGMAIDKGKTDHAAK
jgi:hypothetical protein